MSIQNPTLLDVVNEILSDMGRDEVNELDATPEAARVLVILKDTYRHLCTRNLWEHKMVHKPLDGASDTTKPTKLLIPEDVIHIKSLDYHVYDPSSSENYYITLTHLYPEDFLRIVQGRNASDSSVSSFDNDNNVELRVFNDRAPTYWTSFDDKYVYLDAWNSVLDSTVVTTRTQAHVTVYPNFPAQDTSTFDLPARFMPMFISWAKATCFEKIKQIASPTDQYWSRASYARFLHDGSRVGQERPKKPTYGKRRR